MQWPSECIRCNGHQSASDAMAIRVHQMPWPSECIRCNGHQSASDAMAIRVHQMPWPAECIRCNGHQSASDAMASRVHQMQWPSECIRCNGQQSATSISGLIWPAEPSVVMATPQSSSMQSAASQRYTAAKKNLKLTVMRMVSPDRSLYKIHGAKNPTTVRTTWNGICAKIMASCNTPNGDVANASAPKTSCVACGCACGCVRVCYTCVARALCELRVWKQRGCPQTARAGGRWCVSSVKLEL
jgi:hypothetical protein